MKYEITKGSEKDFEGVPVWALYVETYRGNVFASEGYSAGDRYIALTGLDKGKEFIVDDETNPPGRIIAERRPITEPVWDGEGLPPVGVECNHRPAKHCSVPHKVTILAHTKLDSRDIDVAVFQYGDVISFSDANQFMPIRSPEDVARDEFIKALVDFDNNRKTFGIDKLYGEIYDAISAGKIPGVKLEVK